MPPTDETLPGAIRWPYAALAWLATLLALAGLVLPGLPATPFALAAAWAARRGSPRLDRRLRTHRHIGPLLHHWENGRAIAPRTKAVAVALMTVSWALLAHRTADLWLAIAAALPFAALALFIATRPAPVEVREGEP